MTHRLILYSGHPKELDITSHHNENQNYNKILCDIYWIGYYQKEKKRSSGEDKEKKRILEHYCWENSFATFIVKDSRDITKRLKIELPNDSAIPLLKTYPAKIKWLF